MCQLLLLFLKKFDNEIVKDYNEKEMKLYMEF